MAVQMSSRSKLIIMGCTMLGLFLAAMDQTVVGTALPRVIASLGGLSLYSWVFTAYMLTSTTTVPIAGKLSDLYGRKRFYMAGIVIFLTGSALAGTSQNMLELILFRGFQGIGGGLLFASAFAIIGDLFAPAERGRYAGLMTGAFGLASVIGPLIGGALTDTLSWRWVFYVNLPLGLVTLGVLFVFLPSFKAKGVERRIDYLGAAVLPMAIVPMLLAFVWAGDEYAWGSPQVTGLLSFSAMMLGVFYVVERRAADPIIPMWLFRSRIFTVAVATTFLTGVAMFGNSLFIPLFMQGVVGTSATNSGLVLTPMTLSLAVGATIGGQIISRAGRYVAVVVVGAAIMTFGMYLLSLMGTDTSRLEATRNMAVVGFGLGFMMPSLVIAVQNAFSYQVLGVVTSSVTFFRSIGGTIGVAVLGSLMTTRLNSELATNIPASVREAAPPSLMDRLADPEVLLSPGGMAQLRAASERLGGDAAAIFDQVIAGMRVSLSEAIDYVFFVAMIISLVAVIVSLLLKEVPLRKTLDMPAAAAAPEAGLAPTFVDPSPAAVAQHALSATVDFQEDPQPPEASP
jgi:EmrB/QacA subfamily drug resistance transporter